MNDKLSQERGDTRMTTARRKKLSTYEIISLIISTLWLISLVLLLFQTRIMSKQTDNMALQTENMLKQTQQLTESLENTALTNISNRDLEMSKIFFEHPDLLPYFFSGEGIKEGNKNYDKVYALAGMRIDLVGT